MLNVTAAIIVEKGKVLLARRAANTTNSGRWEFPGGKIENDETVHECLIRELYEELGVKVIVKDFIAESIYDYPTGTIRLLAYAVDIVSGDINLAVHDSFKWVDHIDLMEYDLLPADIPIAIKLKEVLK